MTSASWIILDERNATCFYYVNVILKLLSGRLKDEKYFGNGPLRCIYTSENFPQKNRTAHAVRGKFSIPWKIF